MVQKRLNAFQCLEFFQIEIYYKLLSKVVLMNSWQRVATTGETLKTSIRWFFFQQKKISSFF